MTDQYEQWDQTRRRIWPNADHNDSASYVEARRVAWAGNEHEAGGESRWIAVNEAAKAIDEAALGSAGDCDNG